MLRDYLSSGLCGLRSGKRLPSIKETFRIAFQNCCTLKMIMWKGREKSCEMQGFLSSSFYPPSKVVFIKKMIYKRKNWTQKKLNGTQLFQWHWVPGTQKILFKQKYCFTIYCYRRPHLQAWLLPDLNIIPNSCVRENSLQLSGYVIGFGFVRLLVRILS